MANNYKVKIVDLQNKYKFKIFAISSNTVMKNEIDALYQAWPKESGTGTDVNLTGVIAAPMNIDLKGNASQDGTPTPSSPIPINVVSGDNTITISNSDNTESQSYSINLGTIELCKIGDYQDYIYKENDKWYIHKEIRKVVLNGSEDWFINTGNRFRVNLPSEDGYYVALGLSDRYSYTDSWDTHLATNYSFTVRNGNWGVDGCRLSFINTDYPTVTAFINNLATNNITAYYQLLPKLGGATTTEITDTTLISQLEALKSAVSYAGQTNISQVNDDEAFIISASALKDLSNL